MAARQVHVRASPSSRPSDIESNELPPRCKKQSLVIPLYSVHNPLAWHFESKSQLFSREQGETVLGLSEHFLRGMRSSVGHSSHHRVVRVPTSCLAGEVSQRDKRKHLAWRHRIDTSCQPLCVRGRKATNGVHFLVPLLVRCLRQ